MAGPPKDVPASELFQKLLERPEPSVVVDFPRKNEDGKPVGQVRIRVLRMEEHDEARISAIDALKKRGVMTSDVAYESLLGDGAARELLARACLTDKAATGTDDSETGPLYGRIFRTAADVNKLTADEVSVLFGYYLQVQKRFGPYEASFQDPQEVNAWVQRLVEGAAAYPLSALPSPDVQELTLCLAQRASRLSEIMSSQPEDLPALLASLPTSWVIGTYSSTEPAPLEMTPERAREIIERLS
jgi:hypothetical protein